MKIISFLTVIVMLILGACSPVTPVSSSDEQSMPIIEEQPATEVTTEEPASVSPNVSATAGYQTVNVSDVNVEVGVGSPIPVFVDIGAVLPDLCAQVEFVEVIQNGNTFKLNVGTIPSTDEACLMDTAGFRMKIPLSVVGLPAGSYGVQVNGVATEFQLESNITSGELRMQETPIVKEDVQVDDIRIEVGLGSPRPVIAVISANLPNACAQLGEVQMHREGTQYFVRLIAYSPKGNDCSRDMLPMRIELPLNTINLPDGTYEVLVNGATTTFEMPLK